MDKFHTIDYLAKGSKIQRLAYKTLTDSNIINILRPYTPLLAGTVPIDIAIDTSDLDILCCFTNADNFYNYLTANLSSNENFEISLSETDSLITVVATFTMPSFTIEIFGQENAVINQYGYKHMVAENNILKAKGAIFRRQVIQLKKTGYKTEPAFAKLMGLTGNPYVELLKYY